jgi:hypothetical protein
MAKKEGARGMARYEHLPLCQTAMELTASIETVVRTL